MGATSQGARALRPQPKVTTSGPSSPFDPRASAARTRQRQQKGGLVRTHRVSQLSALAIIHSARRECRAPPGTEQDAPLRAPGRRSARRSRRCGPARALGVAADDARSLRRPSDSSPQALRSRRTTVQGSSDAGTACVIGGLPSGPSTPGRLNEVRQDERPRANAEDSAERRALLVQLERHAVVDLVVGERDMVLEDGVPLLELDLLVVGAALRRDQLLEVANRVVRRALDADWRARGEGGGEDGRSVRGRERGRAARGEAGRTHLCDPDGRWR